MPTISSIELPPADTERWVPRRKLSVVLGIESGMLTRQEACERYGLSREELDDWERRFAYANKAGLAITKLRRVPGTRQ